jgi:hypothetical protein
MTVMVLTCHGQVAVMSNRIHAQKGELDPETTALLRQAGVSDTASFALPDPFGRLPHLVNPTDWLPQVSVDAGSWELGIDNFYAGGQAASYFGSGWFSDLRAERRITIAGLPLCLAADAVVQNNQLNRRLSSLTVAFDYQALMERYRHQAGQANLQKTFARLSKDEQTLLSKQGALEHWQEALQSKAFYEGKAVLQARIDSLRHRQGPY